MKLDLTFEKDSITLNEISNILCSKPSITFEQVTSKMAKTYKAKNHDYGNAFDKSLNKFGLVAACVRMGDKMNRLEALINSEAKVKDESIDDTLLDLATYAIMTYMWKNNK